MTHATSIEAAANEIASFGITPCDGRPALYMQIIKSHLGYREGVPTTGGFYFYRDTPSQKWDIVYCSFPNAKYTCFHKTNLTHGTGKLNGEFRGPILPPS